MPPGKAREYFHPGDPRPKSPLRQRRRAQYDDAERNPSPLSPSRFSPSPSLPRSPLSTSRRLSQWGREKRRSIRVDVLCTMACLRERRALTPKVVLTRLHVLPRIDVSLPFSSAGLAWSTRSVASVPLLPPNQHRGRGAESATRRRRPLLRPPHSTMARVTFTRYQDYS